MMTTFQASVIHFFFASPWGGHYFLVENINETEEDKIRFFFQFALNHSWEEDI